MSSVDELVAAQVELEKSRTTSARLLESLANKIGARMAARDAAGVVQQPSAGSPDAEGVTAGFARIIRQPAVAALAAAAAGYLLVAAFRKARR